MYQIHQCPCSAYHFLLACFPVIIELVCVAILFYFRAATVFIFLCVYADVRCVQHRALLELFERHMQAHDQTLDRKKMRKTLQHLANDLDLGLTIA